MMVLTGEGGGGDAMDGVSRVCPGTAIHFYTRQFSEEVMEAYEPPEMLTQPLEQVGQSTVALCWR